MVKQDILRVFNAGPSGDDGHGRPCGRGGAVRHLVRFVVQRGHPRRGRIPRSVRGIYYERPTTDFNTGAAVGGGGSDSDISRIHINLGGYHGTYDCLGPLIRRVLWAGGSDSGD